MTDQYIFGDTDVAARRLEVLAGAFAASSRAFLAEAAKLHPRAAVDLGCGPGYTTHLLAESTRCGHVVGLDNSEHFIRLATKTATDEVSFRLHDVTETPFPVGPCDLIYVRFLLTHQRNPTTLVARWATQLAPRGRLLVEEVEAIHTKEPQFAEYIDIVEAMLADGGYDLYVGSRLDAMPDPTGLVRVFSRAARVPVTNDLAARMFSMNMRTWKHSTFVRKRYSPASIRELEEGLTELAGEPTDKTDIEWLFRQLGWEMRE